MGSKNNAVRIKHGDKYLIILKSRKERNLGTKIVEDKKKKKNKYKCRKNHQKDDFFDIFTVMKKELKKYVK